MKLSLICLSAVLTPFLTLGHAMANEKDETVVVELGERELLELECAPLQNPRDSDSCLQASPGWSSTIECDGADVDLCDSKPKDMQRCCPVRCDTSTLTEDTCNALSGSGTCTYPNEAQCATDSTNPSCKRVNTYADCNTDADNFYSIGGKFFPADQNTIINGCCWDVDYRGSWMFDAEVCKFGSMNILE
mmetsp:Transcript_37668/g.38121  ORF Transcript_37668/g.38121 Transcript_37668/m.38121 type:complete len:190 (-) Transcript_37668:9-578(-)